jgi:hypothetical protein
VYDIQIVLFSVLPCAMCLDRSCSAGLDTLPEHIRVTCAPLSELPMEYIKSQVIVEGKAKQLDRICLPDHGDLAINPPTDVRDAFSAWPQQAQQQQHFPGEAEGMWGASQRMEDEGGSQALSDLGSLGNSNWSAASDESADEENAVDLDAAAVATGVAVASPGKCKDCEKECIKNWFECAYPLFTLPCPSLADSSCIS